MSQLRSKEAVTKLIKNSIISLLDKTAKINWEAANTVAPLLGGGYVCAERREAFQIKKEFLRLQSKKKKKAANKKSSKIALINDYLGETDPGSLVRNVFMHREMIIT